MPRPVRCSSPCPLSPGNEFRNVEATLVRIRATFVRSARGEIRDTRRHRGIRAAPGARPRALAVYRGALRGHRARTGDARSRSRLRRRRCDLRDRADRRPRRLRHRDRHGRGQARSRPLRRARERCDERRVPAGERERLAGSRNVRPGVLPLPARASEPPARSPAGMWAAAQPGGAVAVEDADFDGAFCDPPNHGYEFWARTYPEVLRRHGGDPQMGGSSIATSSKPVSRTRP